jgi:hypothetical protein
MNNRSSLYSNAVLLALIIVLLGSSCKKYIYQGPITSTYESSFWTAQTSVEQATLAIVWAITQQPAKRQFLFYLWGPRFRKFSA